MKTLWNKSNAFINSVMGHIDAFADSKVLLILFYFGFNTLTQSSYLDLPLYWDEIHYYYRPIFDMFENGALSIFVHPEIQDGHPPGFHLLYYLLVLPFGPSVYGLRIITLLATTFAAFFAHKISHKVAGHSAGFLAGILILTDPVFLSINTKLLGEPLQFPLALGFIYYLISKKNTAALAFGFLTGIVRQTSLAFVPFSVLYVFLFARKSSKAWLAAFSPVFGLSLVFLNHSFLTGRAVSHPAALDNHFGGYGLLGIPLGVIERIHNHNNFQPSVFYALLVLASLVLFAVSIIRSSPKQRKELKDKFVLAFLLVVPLVCGLVVFSTHKFYLLRYNIPFLALAFSVTGAGFHYFGRKIPYLLIGCSLCLFSTSYSNHIYSAPDDKADFSYGYGYEYDSNHIEAISLYLRSLNWLSRSKTSEETVYSTWPVYLKTQKAEYGYVLEPFQIHDFTYSLRLPQKGDWVIVCNICSGPQRQLRNILETSTEVKLMQSFENRLGFFDFYQFTDSPTENPFKSLRR